MRNRQRRRLKSSISTFSGGQQMTKMRTSKRKRQSSLSDRLKRGELYIVFGGFDYEGGTMSFLSYGDPARSPRIYKRGAVDDRLESTLPVCRLFRTAVRRLKGETYAVLLPLSEMVKIWGPREVKRWAPAQRHVTPKEVREYVDNFVAMAV
jgi:hypothetical protein